MIMGVCTILPSASRWIGLLIQTLPKQDDDDDDDDSHDLGKQFIMKSPASLVTKSKQKNFLLVARDEQQDQGPAGALSLWPKHFMESPRAMEGTSQFRVDAGQI